MSASGFCPIGLVYPRIPGGRIALRIQ